MAFIGNQKLKIGREKIEIAQVRARKQETAGLD